MRSILNRGISRSATLNPVAVFQAHRRMYCIPIKVPFIAESITEGKIEKWLRKVGDVVAEDENLCEVGSDKKQVEVKAPCSGTITAISVEEGAKVNVEQIIGQMKKGDGPAKTAKPTTTTTTTTTAAPEAAAPKVATPAPVSTPTAPKVPEGIVSGSDPRTRRVRTTSMRQRIADRLKASQNTSAMLTTFNEIDMGNLMELREKYQADFQKKHGVKLGFMSAFVKASAAALVDVPIVNATWEDEFVAYHDYVDISVAVSTPTGLVVPVLRDVQDMSFADIEKKIAEYGEKAKNKTLSVAEMTGGTFTISNGGVFGSWMGTPIINPPQSAILGMHATKKKPWVDSKGNIVVRPIMAVALTYDHRIIDGRDAVTFLVKIKNVIEDPSRLLLDLP